MEAQELSIGSCWRLRGTLHEDSRGAFAEVFARESVERALQRPVEVAQINFSFSGLNVVRGIHGSFANQGQAKFVLLLAGEILDVVVDLRPGSSTFGEWEAVSLTKPLVDGIFVAEGFGHAFWSRKAGSQVIYATSSAYRPSEEFALNPLDPELQLPWLGQEGLILSDRDREAPCLSEWFSTPH